MRFSLDWLRTHLEISEPPEVVARLLADAGLPADAVTPFGADVHLDLDVPSNRPDCRWARGPSMSSAKTCSMTAWPRWCCSACSRMNGLSLNAAW